MSLNRKGPDLVPVDVGGTHDTTYLMSSYTRLRDYLGSQGTPTCANRWLGSVYLDEETMKKLDVDFRPIALPAPEYQMGRYGDRMANIWNMICCQ